MTETVKASVLDKKINAVGGHATGYNRIDNS